MCAIVGAILSGSSSDRDTCLSIIKTSSIRRRKNIGHEYGDVGKIFVHFDYACVPLFCALVVFTAIPCLTPLRSHSS